MIGAGRGYFSGACGCPIAGAKLTNSADRSAPSNTAPPLHHSSIAAPRTASATAEPVAVYSSRNLTIPKTRPPALASEHSRGERNREGRARLGQRFHARLMVADELERIASRQSGCCDRHFLFLSTR